MPHDVMSLRSEQAHRLATRVRQQLPGLLAPLLGTLDQHLGHRQVVTSV